MKVLKFFILFILLATTYAIHIYHLGVYPWKPPAHAISGKRTPPGVWIDKSKFGIHQLTLSGSDYDRGYAEGSFTQSIIQQQEKELVSRLKKVFPYPVVLQLFDLGIIRWFYGIEQYLDPRNIDEMAGVAEWTSHDFDYLTDRLSRQVAYHGLHEVGQMLVDQTGDDMGCTVLAYPQNRNRWLIGRNFDFEGGRVFDTDKIMKWVYPDEGYAFVSVIWAGMVGAVTGVNENGVYLSLNAAGSTDFARYGTPSTLVLLKALQFSKTAQQAIEIIRAAQMFITDIFVVSDRTTGKLFRVEKSPKFTEVIELTKPSVVTNHLMSPRWKKDRINLFREFELTSHARMIRGEALLQSLNGGEINEEKMVSFLRDKDELGNRNAIDAQIATHSVIYNEEKNELFVSQGPSLAGAFSGFDLSLSFQKKEPIAVRVLPGDPRVSIQTYQAIQDLRGAISDSMHLAKNHQCAEARAILLHADPILRETDYGYHFALGNIYQCEGKSADARAEWLLALNKHPAYAHEKHSLEKLVTETKP